MSQSPHKHLIVAGVTRAGTTSMYEYLAAHPQVSRSRIKESRYFLGGDYPLPRHLPPGTPLEAYLKLFTPSAEANPDHVLMEATPDYVYCKEAARRIRQALPHVSLVVILREPIQRLVSWHRYAQQNNLLSADVTLDEYVDRQRRADPDDPTTPQHMRSLEQGRYERYLQAFLEVLGRERCLVLPHDELCEDPRRALQAISRHAGIEAAFYDGYRFEVVNESVAVRNQGVHAAYKKAAWSIRSKVIHHPRAHGLLRNVRRWFYPMYARTNHRKSAAQPCRGMSPQTRAFLTEYYRDVPEALGRLTGLDFTGWTACNNPVDQAAH